MFHHLYMFFVQLTLLTLYMQAVHQCNNTMGHRELK